jgi:hypothetical protein
MEVLEQAFRCGDEHCVRPACCTIGEEESQEKHYCYFHVACEKKAKIKFYDLKTAQRQAKEFRQVATQVWEDLAQELEDVGLKKRKKESTDMPQQVAKPARPAEPVAAATSKKPKREQVWDIIVDPGTRSTDNQTISLTTQQKYDGACPNCKAIGTVTFQCISSAISAGKSDTWGSSSRPDRVFRYTCSTCLYSWLVEEG